MLKPYENGRRDNLPDKKIHGLLERQKLKHFSKKLLTLRLDPTNLSFSSQRFSTADLDSTDISS